MKRRPSLRSWLRTAQRWYSSAECAAEGIWMARRMCRMVSEKSSVACHFALERLRTSRLDLGGVVARQRALGPDRHLVAQHRRQQRPALIATGQRRGAQRRRVRRADHRDRAHHPRVQHRRRPADQAAVGVTDQRGRLVPERADQSRRVAGQRPAVVAARRFVAAAVAAQVDRHHAGAGQAAQLVSPGPPERPEPVQQDDQRPRRSPEPTPPSGARPRRRGSESRWRARRDGATDRRCASPTDRAGLCRRGGSGHYQPDGSAVARLRHFAVAR